MCFFLQFRPNLQNFYPQIKLHTPTIIIFYSRMAIRESLGPRKFSATHHQPLECQSQVEIGQDNQILYTDSALNICACSIAAVMSHGSLRVASLVEVVDVVAAR